MGLPRRAGDPAELRKNLKPLLEKRRRARINASLSQLKGLILPLLGRERPPTATAKATELVWHAWPACYLLAVSWSLL
uniref:Hes family bHLH transcription factor 2 n=2 Tax=Sus scrofa TaxID=9823 RepID=A0A8D1VGW5_PIG